MTRRKCNNKYYATLTSWFERGKHRARICVSVENNKSTYSECYRTSVTRVYAKLELPTTKNRWRIILDSERKREGSIGFTIRYVFFFETTLNVVAKNLLCFFFGTSKVSDVYTKRYQIFSFEIENVIKIIKWEILSTPKITIQTSRNFNTILKWVR